MKIEVSKATDSQIDYLFMVARGVLKMAFMCRQPPFQHMANLLLSPYGMLFLLPFRCSQIKIKSKCVG